MNRIVPVDSRDYSPIIDMQFETGNLFGINQCSPGWEWEPSEFKNFDLWYVFSGKGTMQLNGEEFPLRKGTCILIQPGDQPTATQEPHDRITLIYVHFHAFQRRNTNEITETIQPVGRFPSYYQVFDTYLFENMLYRLLDLCDCQLLWKEQEFDLQLKQALLVLFRPHVGQADSTQSSKKNIHSMHKLMLRLRNEPASGIDDSEISLITGLSPRYANRLFRAYSGHSIKQFAIRVKLERALHLLSETNMNVSQVAQTLGYSDLYFFSKQFKNHYGFPPSACK